MKPIAAMSGLGTLPNADKAGYARRHKPNSRVSFRVSRGAIVLARAKTADIGVDFGELWKSAVDTPVKRAPAEKKFVPEAQVTPVPTSVESVKPEIVAPTIQAAPSSNLPDSLPIATNTDPLPDAASSLTDALGGLGSTASEKAAEANSLLQGAASALSSASSKALQSAQGLTNRAVEGITTSAGNIIDKASDSVETITSKAGKVVEGVTTGASKALESASDSVSSIASKASQAVEDATSGGNQSVEQNSSSVGSFARQAVESISIPPVIPETAAPPTSDAMTTTQALEDAANRLSSQASSASVEAASGADKALGAVSLDDAAAGANQALSSAAGVSDNAAAGASKALSSAAGVSDNAAAGASKALSSVTGGLGNVTEGASKALEGATGSLTAATENASKALAGVGGSVTDATKALQDVAGNLTGGASSALSSTTEAISSTTAAATDAIGSLLGQVTSRVTSLQDAATSAVTGLQQTTTAATSSSTGAIRSALSGVTSQVEGALGSATAKLGSALAPVTSKVGTALAPVTEKVGAALQPVVDKALQGLPEPARDAANAVGGKLQELGAVAASHPRESFVVATALAVPVAVAQYNARYGGFAGELAPEAVRKILQEEEALLVDIRPDDEVARDGVVQLKLGARFKAARWEFVGVDPGLLKRVNNAESFILQVNAALVAGLTQVKSKKCKIIVMDSEGSDVSRRLARALRTIGIQKPYIVEGGYLRWASDGLPVVQGPMSYDASIADFINDEIEVISGAVNEKLTPLKNPLVGVPVGFGTIAAGYAAFHWHEALQFLGVLGLLGSATNKALQYESPEALFADLSATVEKLLSMASSSKAAVKKAQVAPVSAAAAIEQPEESNGVVTQVQPAEPQPAAATAMTAAADMPAQESPAEKKEQATA